MINSRVKATIVFFVALMCSNLAIADEDLPGLIGHMPEGIRFTCELIYGENNHVDLLSASASNVQRFCAYASHPVDDMGALCYQFFGDNPPSKASGRIQWLCAKLQRFTKHEPPPNPFASGTVLGQPHSGTMFGQPLGDLGPSLSPKLGEHLGGGLGLNPSQFNGFGFQSSLPSKLPDHPMASPLPSKSPGDGPGFDLWRPVCKGSDGKYYVDTGQRPCR